MRPTRVRNQNVPEIPCCSFLADSLNICEAKSEKGPSFFADPGRLILPLAPDGFRRCLPTTTEASLP